jgi:ankyrin repeat protein
MHFIWGLQKNAPRNWRRATVLSLSAGCIVSAIFVMGCSRSGSKPAAQKTAKTNCPSGKTEGLLTGSDAEKLTKSLEGRGISVTDDGLANAIEQNSVSDVKALISLGVSVNGSSNGGTAPLALALPKVDETLAELLVQSGANVNHAKPGEVVPIVYAANYRSAKLLKLMLEHCGDPRIQAPDEPRHSILSAAIHAAQVDDPAAEKVALALQYKADPNKITGLGLAPIQWASAGSLPAVKLLISYGADVKYADPRDWTPLITAINTDNPDIAAYLIDSGASLATSSDGTNPASLARAKGMTAIVEKLVAKGLPRP